ncbi:NAD-dependent epimerase/dehydratase family protein [Geomonas terrae]|uniref:NAD-dependent epimerase/dehydratase family protein n=1 Tax=Geomonas terrae TaxID=2562681 RepID=A0A4S1CFJ9_9BACT|nr:NAD-dependent epimerase/dehydratase family protein [Geomonas terrae]TGU72281.1 NAD-dependent epimerase/dehydratase family protein [Geomonas terrae]
MKNCYLIGGSGFIGRHLAQLLSGTQRRLTVVGRKPVCDPPLPEGVNYLSGNYGDDEILDAICGDADEIVLLAYSTVPKTSFDDPVLDIMTNLPAAVKLFEKASHSRVGKLVFVSSGGTVYGNPSALPIAEDHHTTPISPYGITKLAIEKYAAMFHQTAGLPVICVRPGNAYGEGQRPFSGQGFIATAMASIVQGKEVVLFGATGTVRDYLHVSELAEGVLAVLDHGRVGEAYNIGSGRGYSNRDILDCIAPMAAAAGLDMVVNVLPPRLFDVQVNILDCAKMERETGWRAVGDLKEGLQKTWDWFLSARGGNTP